jgi:hypothetical protein
MHHEIRTLRTLCAEAEARLVNIAAKPRAKNLRDEDHGGSSALLLPTDAQLLATALRTHASKYAAIWMFFYNLYNGAHLFGTAIPPGISWKDANLRFSSPENAKLGEVGEFFELTPPSLHMYILTSKPPFPSLVCPAYFLPNLL